MRHWMTNGEATVAPGKAADTGGSGGDSIGNLFYGSKGYMAVDSYTSYKTWLGKAQEPGRAARKAATTSPTSSRPCASRERNSLNAEIEEGAASTVLVHLANISYRVGRTINFDPETMTITGDAEAAKMMTRPYRKGFEVPAKV